MFLLKNIIIIVFTALCICSPEVKAQGVYTDPREAEDYYNRGDYYAAIPVYKKLTEQSPSNINYHYRMGICYLKSNTDKSKAIPYFEWITKQSKFNQETWYELGKAYHYAGRFNEAIKACLLYKQSTDAQGRENADKEIAECNTAKELMLHPVNVTIENLGRNINSQYPDYYPLVNQDESILIFTVRRPGPTALYTEMDGYYASNIFISNALNGVWQKARGLGEQINSTRDQEAVGLNSSGSEMIIYIDNIKEYGYLCSSKRKGNTFLKPTRLPESINSNFQSSGDISDDGKVLFYTSERPGGYGGTDIYMIRKLASGKWAIPQNLGSEINTPYNEDFPWLDADKTTLYFSSQGHSTMGDYDLFESKWTNPDSNTWSDAKNLGYPINTTGDDRCISFTKDHHAAYISRIRPEGYGDLDIYKVTFNDMQRFAIVTGNIITGDHASSINATITVTNTKTQAQFYFKPIHKNGHYVMALLPGIYDLRIECKGYLNMMDKLVIYDLNSFKAEMVKNYTLKQSIGIISNTQTQVLFSSSKH